MTSLRAARARVVSFAVHIYTEYRIQNTVHIYRILVLLYEYP